MFIDSVINCLIYNNLVRNNENVQGHKCLTPRKKKLQSRHMEMMF